MQNIGAILQETLKKTVYKTKTTLADQKKKSR